MLQEPLVSIIIPAYNVSQYLERCSSSIVNQTYRNLEILVVDDGSTDGTGLIADKWEKNDSRIVVIHKNNGGLSSARNTGLPLVHGQYLIFVDSDDYLKEELIDICLKKIRQYKVEVVYFGYSYVNDSGSIKEEPVAREDIMVSNPIELVLSGRVQSHAWQYMCETSLYRGIEYPVGMDAEDLATTYQVIARSKCALLIPDNLYCYRYRSDSILNKIFHGQGKAISYFSDELKAFHSMISWSRDTGNERYLFFSFNQMLFHLYSHYNQAITERDEETVRWLKSQIGHELSVKKNIRLTRKNSILTFLFKMNLLKITYTIHMHLFNKL